MSDTALAFWQVDLEGSRVQLTQAQRDLVERAIVRDLKTIEVTDINGSATLIMLHKIECITFITPASVAAYRTHQREFCEAVDVLDPEGAMTKPAPWESE